LYAVNVHFFVLQDINVFNPTCSFWEYSEKYVLFMIFGAS